MNDAYARTFPQVRDLVADSLALDADEVTLEACLIPDLGADSLDFIDMLFGLEKAFGVKIREGELDFLARVDVSDPSALQGALSPEAIAQLRPWLPALEGAEQVTAGQLLSLVSVETLCILVERKLDAAAP